MPADKYDIDVLMTSIKNRVHQQNFLGATTHLIMLQRLVPAEFKQNVKDLISHISEEAKQDRHSNPTLIEAELDELRAEIFSKIKEY